MDKELKIEYVVAASVREAGEIDLDDMAKSSIADQLELAAGPIVEGKPRMLLLTAWIAHEGRNNNGDAFLKEELKEELSERSIL